MTEGPQNTAPGWYPHPNGEGLAYWDGSAWTATAPTPPAAPFADPSVKAGNGLSIAAIVMGVLAVLILPIILGPAAIICGGVAMSRKEPLGRTGLIVGIVGMIAGFALGIIVARSTN
ncbi:MAG: hypothetical protein NVS3B1_25350 [Marmoricola sp.]